MSVMRVDWSRWRGLGVTGIVSPRFAHLLPHRQQGGAAAGATPSREAIRNAAPAERAQLVDRMLRDKIARLLGVAAEQLDNDTPLLDLGLDSLMAVEIRNWIESQLQVDLPVVQLMRSPGLRQLVSTVCDELGEPDENEPADEQGPPHEADLLPYSDPQQLLDNIDQLSGDQVDLLLATLMEEETMKQQGSQPTIRKGP